MVTSHTAARRQAVAELSAAGKTPKEIAAVVGASLEVVYQDRLKVFPAAGRPPGEGRRRRRRRVQEMAAAGRAPEQIAVELGVSADTVNKDLRGGGAVRGRPRTPPPDPLPPFDPDRAAVYVAECRKAGSTVAARRAKLDPAEVRGWLHVGKRWRLPPFAAFHDAVIEARGERREAFKARAERNRLLTPAAVAELRGVLRRRLADHFSQPHVRTRIQRALDLPRGDYWSVIATVEAHLFDPDGHPGLIPDTGFERCSPVWLTALAERLAGTPVTLATPAP